MKLKTGHYLIAGIAVVVVIALAKGKGCCNGGNKKANEPIIPEPVAKPMEYADYVGASLGSGWLAGRTLLVDGNPRSLFPDQYYSYTLGGALAGRELIPDGQGRKIVSNFCCV